MAKTKVLTDVGLTTYHENMKSYIKSQGLGLSKDDINGLIDQKLVPVNETIENKVEKVDGKGLSTNDYTDEEKTQVATNKTDISLLKEEVEDLQNEIVNTTSNTLSNSKPGGLRLLGMKGGTEQKTLSGKNLVNVPDGSYTINDVSVSISGGIVSVNGTPTSAGGRNKYIARTTLPSGTYTISLKEKTGTLCTIAVTDVANSGSAISIFGNIATFTLANETTIGVGINVALNNSYNGSFKIQIEAGEVATDYEPYCGGTPSPNPEYQQSIHNTGDCVEMIQGYYSGLNAGVWVSNPQSVCNEHKIPCKQGDIINIECEIEPQFIMFVYYDQNGNLISDKKTSFSVTITDSSIKYFNFYVKHTTKITPSTVGKIQLTINGKYVVQIVEHGKNLLDVNFTSQTQNGVTATVNNDKSVTLSGATNASNTFFNLNYTGDLGIGIPPGDYIVSGGKSSSIRLQVIVDSTIISNEYGNGANITIPETANSSWLRIQIPKSGVETNVTLYPMIREVGTDPTYEPYTEKVATIFLDKPLCEGDRLVKVDGVWNVERHSAEVVFDGSDDEECVLASAYENLFVYPNLGTDSSTALGNLGLCSHYMINTVGISAMSHGGFRISDNLYFKNTSVSTLEEWKALLQSNPITVQYKLATPTYEVLDTASQIALNSLKTFDTVTHITVDSVTQPAELEVEYGKSISSALTLKANNDNDNYKIQLNSISSITTDAIDSLFTS